LVCNNGIWNYLKDILDNDVWMFGCVLVSIKCPYNGRCVK